MQNRLAKLGGTLVWGFFASGLQRPPSARAAWVTRMSAHAFLGVGMVCSALCCVVRALPGPSEAGGAERRAARGARRTGRTGRRVARVARPRPRQVVGHSADGLLVQLALAISGFFYGVSDSAGQLLILWTWQDDNRRQRMYVALLNAMFTVGGLLTPILVAGSLRYSHGQIWAAFDAVGVLGLLVGLAFPLLRSPAAPHLAAAAEETELVPLSAAEAAAPLPPEHSESEPPGTASKYQRSEEPAQQTVVFPARAGRPRSDYAVLEMVTMLMICTVCFSANGAPGSSLSTPHPHSAALLPSLHASPPAPARARPHQPHTAAAGARTHAPRPQRRRRSRA